MTLEILYPVAYAIAAYTCTRGQDGELFLLLFLFSCLFVCELVTTFVLRTQISYLHITVMTLIKLSLSLGAMAYDNHLEEMAGMLKIIVPVLILLIAFNKSLLLFITRWKSV